MGFLQIFMLVGTILMGIWAAVCLKGCDWVFISGYIHKDDRDKFRKEHDMPAMNRYLAKAIVIPLMMFFAVFQLLWLFVPQWIESTWFGIGAGLAAIILMVRIFSTLPRIFGDSFKRDGNGG